MIPEGAEVFQDAQDLAQAAADFFLELSADRSASNADFRVALSGGSTPQHAYRLLGCPPLSERVNWSEVQIFWGDERCVPPDHPDSNYGMARANLLDHVPLPPSHIHRIHGERSSPLSCSSCESCQKQKREENR